MRPALGRLLGPLDAEPGATPVAVVSWAYWNRFNLDPRILGTQISVSNVSARVVCVASQEFAGLLTGYRPDVWLPAAAHPASRQAGFMLMAWLRQASRSREDRRVCAQGSAVAQGNA
ncbi:MAG: ABC transporter permease [Acidobacteria bacterium]|nr:ABC transporter permease [Acidobacteriota bacterium]